jgi:hypothetical protein
MSEQGDKIIRLGGKPFRRVRKHVGETWKPDQRILPNTELGVYCPHCRSVHPWRNKRTLGTKYERRSSGNWVIMWICNNTGNVIKEEGLLNHGKHI